MADDTQTDDLQPAPAVAAIVLPAPTAPAEDLDETVPGGAYMVGSQLVDAEGQPVKTKGRRT